MHKVKTLEEKVDDLTTAVSDLKERIAGMESFFKGISLTIGIVGVLCIYIFHVHLDTSISNDEKHEQNFQLITSTVKNLTDRVLRLEVQQR